MKSFIVENGWIVIGVLIVGFILIGDSSIASIITNIFTKASSGFEGLF